MFEPFVYVIYIIYNKKRSNIVVVVNFSAPNIFEFVLICVQEKWKFAEVCQLL